MKGQVFKTPEALADLAEQGLYLSHDSPNAALRFYEAAEAAFEQLAVMPGIGSARDYASRKLRGLRMWRVPGFEKHLIFYQPTDAGITIVRVLHGARDIPNLLDLDADSS
jgi:toxin ParE1/3/4